MRSFTRSRPGILGSIPAKPAKRAEGVGVLAVPFVREDQVRLIVDVVRPRLGGSLQVRHGVAASAELEKRRAEQLIQERVVGVELLGVVEDLDEAREVAAFEQARVVTAHAIEQVGLHCRGRHFDVLVAWREPSRPVELDQRCEGRLERILPPLELRLEKLLAGLEHGGGQARAACQSARVEPPHEQGEVERERFLDPDPSQLGELDRCAVVGKSVAPRGQAIDARAVQDEILEELFTRLDAVGTQVVGYLGVRADAFRQARASIGSGSTAPINTQ